MKKLYDLATPYLQVGGYFVMLGSIFTGLWMIYSFIQQGNASAATLNDYAQFKEETQQQLSSLQRGQEDMSKEVHIIYSHLIGHP